MNKTFAVAEVKSIDSTDPNGEFEVILSAPTLDRDGEVIDAKAFKSPTLPDHITFDIDHGLSTSTTVGSGTPFYEGDLLKVKGTFSSIPRAQEVRTLVNEGHIRTTSVAFKTIQRDRKDGVTHITQAELLNGSFVPVPSNREAMIISSKSDNNSDTKAGARNSSTDSTRLQDIHDLSVENGANCTTKAAHGESTKSIVGTVESLQDRCSDALEDSYGEEDDYEIPRAWLRGVNASTRVLYFQRNGETFEQPFTDDGAVVTLTGDAVEVDVLEIVVPDADADREGVETLSQAVADTKQDSTGAADESDENQQMQERLLRTIADTAA